MAPPEETSELQEILARMTQYADYERLLDVRGLAFDFDRFVRRALELEVELARMLAARDSTAE